MHMTPNSMANVQLPILLSWRLEFFELLTQSTSGCPRTGSLSTQARHNSFGLVRSTYVLPREKQIGSSVYFRPWLNLHPWGILSWFHHRPRVKHEGPYHQTLPVVLLPASSNTYGSTLIYIISHPNFGSCLHLHASRFLQQPSPWDKCLPPWPSPIGS